MEPNTLSEDDVLRLLREKCQPHAAGWARDHGLSKMYVSRVLAGIDAPGPSILAALGLRRIVTYQKAA